MHRLSLAIRPARQLPQGSSVPYLTPWGLWDPETLMRLQQHGFMLWLDAVQRQLSVLRII